MQGTQGAKVLAAINPLLELRCLEKFHMSPHFREPNERPPYLMVDGDIERMAFAWPRMQDLRLNLRLAGDGTTFRSLITLALQSPCLRYLDLYSIHVSLNRTDLWKIL